MIRATTAVIVSLAIGAVAYGHDGSDPLSAWYRTLNAEDGTSCCSMMDCAPTQARIRDGHWEVIDPTPAPLHLSLPPPPRDWLPVPPEAVLRRENAAGLPIACIVGGKVKCFVPVSDS